MKILNPFLLAASLAAGYPEMVAGADWRWSVALPANAPADVHPARFVHPGMLHTQAELDCIKSNVAHNLEPWKSAWTAFLACPLIAQDYQPHPFATAGRDKRNNTHQRELSDDMSAAYYNAIAWSVSGDAAYARKSVEIMNAWSYTNQAIVGSDAILAAGIYGYKVANAAEIIRATYPDWKPADRRRMKRWLLKSWYPVVKDLSDGNWGTCCIPTIMSIGVFCDDHEIFTEGVYAYEYGGVGRNHCGIGQYTLPSGQCAESGRDQPHTQGGIAHLAEAAEIAWSQGIDLYGCLDDRLLKAFEYTAAYNLGYEVPFTTFGTGKGRQFETISPQNRGLFSPVYEMVWNHYGNLKGMALPFTQAAAFKTRPERWSVDHPGIGTLTFSLKPDSEQKAPVLPPDHLPK